MITPVKKQKSQRSSITQGQTSLEIHRDIAPKETPANANHLEAALALSHEILGKYPVKHNFQRETIASTSESSLSQSELSNLSKNTENRKNRNSIEDKENRRQRHSIEKRNSIGKTSYPVMKPPMLPPLPSGPPKPKPAQPVSYLVTAVKELLNAKAVMVKPKFRFDISKEAAEFNYNILKEYKFDLDKLLKHGNGNSATTYGSEFKSVQDLEPLLGNHPRWNKLANILQQGSNWTLEPIDEIVRQKDLEGALLRGNHKSAKKNEEFLARALTKEIEKGWELILPIEKAMKIPKLILSPLGVAEHLGIKSDGTFAPKSRVTHDLSFPGTISQTSINSRAVEDAMEPCMFGHTLLRVVHRIIHLREMHPTKIIWIRKEDLKSAYRRIHVNANIAFQSAVQLHLEKNNYLLLSLRLPFGGAPCPSEFSLLSDVITDTINDLMNDSTWNPTALRSEYIHKIPESIRLHPQVPFAVAMGTSVPNKEGDKCSADVFIDDIISVGVHKNDNLQRLMAGPCTVMHAMAHAALGPTNLPHQDLIAEDKNDAEGAPEEVKVVLGWEIDTRRLVIQLPAHKFHAWMSQLTSLIDRKSANSKDLQTMLGRLENVALIIPMFGHFLNNIRATEIKATLTGKNQRINKRTKEDLILAKAFLIKATTGINMNLMTFRRPNHVYINDASEHGLGGFSTSGRGWSWVIPEKLRGRAHINLLEFLAQLVSIWIDIRENRVKKLDCLLGMGDNTASMGWMRRANFREQQEGDLEWYAKQKVARRLAALVLESDTVLYRQWFKGVDNDVADSLSRDAYFLSYTDHTKFLLHTLPTQVPMSFKVQAIPKEIASFITSTLQLLPVKQLRLKPQKPSEVALGNVGLLSSYRLVRPHSIWTVFPSSRKTSSCQHSRSQSGKQLSLQEIVQNWWREQSEPPCHMWHRPSGQTIGRTPDWTLMEKSASSCTSNCEDIGTKTVLNKSKKPCL